MYFLLIYLEHFMQIRKVTAFIISLFLLIPLTLSSQYQISKYVIGNGGGTASNSNYSVSMTVGQPVIGITNNDDMTALLGFWHTIGQLSVLEIVLPGSSWSIISSYIIPQDTDIEVFLADIETNMIIAKNSDGNFYFPSLGINSINDWNVLEGYKLFMSDDDILTIEGLKVNPASTPIPVEPGWNIVAYLRTTSMSVETAFADIVDDIIIVKNSSGQFYFPSLGINNLGNMNPTEGYKVFSESAVDIDLLYPANGSPRRPAGSLTPESKRLIPEVNRTGNSATLLINMNTDYDANEIGAYSTSGVLIGSGIIHEGIAGITIWGDNNMTNIVDGAKDFEPISFKMLNTASGTILDIQLTSIESITTNDLLDDFYYIENGIHYAKGFVPEDGFPKSVTLKNYPNPFADITYIQFYLPGNSDVLLDIYSIDGSQVFSKKLYGLAKGYYNEQFDATLLPSGMYIVKLISEFGQEVTDITIIK